MNTRFVHGGEIFKATSCILCLNSINNCINQKFGTIVTKQRRKIPFNFFLCVTYFCLKRLDLLRQLKVIYRRTVFKCHEGVIFKLHQHKSFLRWFVDIIPCCEVIASQIIHELFIIIYIHSIFAFNLKQSVIICRRKAARRCTKPELSIKV